MPLVDLVPVWMGPNRGLIGFLDLLYESPSRSALDLVISVFMVLWVFVLSFLQEIGIVGVRVIAIFDLLLGAVPVASGGLTRGSS